MTNKILKRVKKINRLLLCIVVIPTLLSSIYFGLIASDVYISESSFVVRSPSNQQALTGIGALLQNTGFTNSQENTFTVHQFMRSRDVLQELIKQFDIAAHYQKQNIDAIGRFGGLWRSTSFEDLYRYFNHKVTIDLDPASSISTLRVRAYSAQDAYYINRMMLEMGEHLINTLNQRGRADLIQFSQKEVTDAQQRVGSAALELKRYRIQNSIFDVPAQTAMQSQLVSKLQDELIAIKTQLAQVSALTPGNVQIPALKERERVVRQEINNELAKIYGAGSGSLTNKTAEYERLQLEGKIAEEQLAAALTALENSTNEAQRKQLYLERIVQPNKPDVAQEPRRLRNIIATLVISLLIFGVISLLLTSVREHQD